MLANTEEDAEWLNRKHREYLSHEKSAKEVAAEIGERLIDVKAKLKHGEFKPWVEANCEFSYRQAAKYMQVAKAKSASRGTFDACASIAEVLRIGKEPEPIKVEGQEVVLDESYGIPHVSLDLEESYPEVVERSLSKGDDEGEGEKKKWPSYALISIIHSLVCKWKKEQHKGKTFGVALLDDVKEHVQFHKDYPEFNQRHIEEELEFLLMMTDELFKIESDLKTQLEELRK